jgi:3-oxoadipate enol-lactonase
MGRVTIDVRGFALSALVEGTEDGAWVTFAHSLATDATLFDEQAQALAERYRILRFDMRGHGQSAAPPGAYALAHLGQPAAFNEALLGFLDDLESPR